MMAGVQNPFLQPLRPVQDYANDYAQADLNRQAVQRNALMMQGQQATLADQQAARDRANAFRAQFVPGSNPDDPEFQNRLFNADPTQAAAFIKTRQDALTAAALAKKDTAQAGNFDAETAQKQYDLHRTMVTHGMQSMLSSATPQQAAQAVTDGVSKGYWSMADAQQKLANIPQDQQQYQQWRLQQLSSLVSAHDQLEAAKPVIQTRNTGGSTDTLAVDPFTGVPTVTGSVKNTASPGEVLQANTSRANNNANIVKDYKLAGLDEKGNDTSGQGGGLSDAAVENAAARYNLDGTLPPNIGRGNQGARDLRRIQNRAAELAMGTDPTKMRIDQLDARSSAAALTQLTKAHTMAGSFEDTANQNAELALSLSKKNDRTGSPLLNAGLQAYRTGTGIPGALQFNASPEASQFAASVDTFTNEYAKIMSGGMGNGAVSDAARAKASSLLSTSMTPEAFEGNVRLLQKEMQNRMRGYENAETKLKTRMGSKGADPAASAATVSNW